MEQRPTYKIVGICGSIRKASTNLSALKHAGSVLTQHKVEFEIINYADLPVYNGDIEAMAIPDSVLTIHK